MPPTEHALLSPSSAHRWLICTPSARLEKKIPETENIYSGEGKLAHEVAELKLRKTFLEPMETKEYNRRLAKLRRTKLYDNGNLRDPKEYWNEILACTDEYLDYINKVTLSYSARPYVAVEQKFDLSEYAPECFGTSDCVIIGERTLHVIDYKHGKGVMVEAEENPQMMLYALGALMRYRAIYSIDRVVMTIVQPRAQTDTVKEWETSAEALLIWGVFTMHPKAQAAFNGEGDFVPGDHCRFCRAKAACRARTTEVQSAAEAFGKRDPALLTNDEIGAALQWAKPFADWYSDLQTHALSAVLAGEEIPGWKAVEGRKTRAFDNADAAFADIIAAGYDEALLYERKPLSLAKVETVLGKPKFAEIAGSHIVSQPGKPTLAPESDNRDAIQTKQTAAEVFGSVNKTEE